MESLEILGVALPVLVGVVLMGLAVVVVRHGKLHRYNMHFAALYFLSGIKSISEGLTPVADGFHAAAPLFPKALFWVIQAAFCSLVMLPLIFLFVASFPRPVAWLARRPALGALAFLPSLLMAALLIARLVDPIRYGTLFVHAATAFNLLGVAVSAIGLVLILRTRTHSSDPIERSQALYVVLGFLPSFVVGWLITGLQLAPVAGLVAPDRFALLLDNLLHFVSPVLELLAAGLVAFAILKYNILGISPKFKFGVKSFAVGFLLVVAFLLTQFVENVVLQGQLFSFAGDYGSFLLSGITGLVLFKPIEMLSNKVSDRLLPKEEDAPSNRAADIYHAQATHILRDGNVSDREWAFLRSLRDQLGLSEAQARRIEEEVERSLGVDDARTGASSTTAPHHLQAAQAVQREAPVVQRATPLPSPARTPSKAAASPATPSRTAPSKSPAKASSQPNQPKPEQTPAPTKASPARPRPTPPKTIK
ncbi:MAG: hypothetical protein AABX89_01520 [Candidatus Thermoplasmatota archaeon]